MAVLKSNSFEVGPDEDALTGPNSSGGGDGFTSVTKAGGSTIVYDSARSVRGSYSTRWDAAANQLCYVTWDLGSNRTTIAYRFYVYFTTAVPTNGDIHLTEIRESGPGDIVSGLVWNDTDQKLYMADTNMN